MPNHIKGFPGDFRPNFDREKFAFLELANRGDGLTPLKYIYSDSSSFKSLLADCIKGGLGELYQLYSTGINTTYLTSVDIKTDTIEANTATVGTIYVKDVHVDNVYVDDLYADNVTIYDDLTVGKLSSLATAIFYTSGFEVLGGAASFDVGAFSVLSEAILLSSPIGLISLTGAAVEINPISSAVPLLGIVGIYSGTKVGLSAPILTVGSIGTRWANTDIININALDAINITSPIFVITADTNIAINTELMTIASIDEISIATNIFNINITGNTTITSDSIIFDTPSFLVRAPTNIEIAAGLGTFNFEEFKVISPEITFNADSFQVNVAQDIEINSEVFTLNASGFVKINADDAAITAVSVVTLKADVISVDSPKTIVPEPRPAAGNGVLFSEPEGGPVEGTIKFTLPNVVTCIAGTLRTVDFEVIITCE